MLIALTGGIAAGKSTVAAIWAHMGAEIIDADDIARQVVEPNTVGHQAIVEKFGTAVLSSSGEINRSALGKIIFQDAQARRELEGILHPLIRAAALTRIAQANSHHVVYAIPLLVESRDSYEFDRICTISAPAEVRAQRLVEHRGLSLADARARIEAQASDAEREALADVVIDSNCSLTELEQRARLAWLTLTNPTIQR